jgi:hypothetical protein
LRRVRERYGRGLQGKSKVSFAQVVWGMVMQALSCGGSLGHHIRTMSNVSISDEAAIARRAGLPWDWFVALFKEVLRPRAQQERHPLSFYHQHRLLGVDGSQWSLRNTQAICSRAGARHRNARSEAAFYKFSGVVLVELGTHQPLAAARGLPCAEGAPGELTLAREVLGAIPQKEDTLLLADRYYGSARFIADVRHAAGERCQLLVRVKSSCKTKVLQKLADGSVLVETRLCQPGTTKAAGVLRLREIRGEVWRQPSQDQEADNRPAPERTQVRLWTTLLDEQEHPAMELLALYAQRWEQELFFGELKRHTGRQHLMRATTLEGAEAEFGASIIAASLLAAQRVETAQSVSLEPARISVDKIGRALEALLPVLNIAGALISARQRQGIIARFLEHTARESIIKPRRARSCQRGVRKPQDAWPRIHQRASLSGPFEFELTPI